MESVIVAKMCPNQSKKTDCQSMMSPSSSPLDTKPSGWSVWAHAPHAHIAKLGGCEPTGLGFYSHTSQCFPYYLQTNPTLELTLDIRPSLKNGPLCFFPLDSEWSGKNVHDL